MAKMEEVSEKQPALEAWKAQRLARALDGQIRELNVALTELESVKPKKATYTKKSNVFFLDRRDVILKAKKGELKEKEKTRRDVGLQLRQTT